MANKRADLITSMSARFAEIVSGSEYISGSGVYYETTLSGSVGVWRVTPIEASEIPYLNIRDVTDSTVDYTTEGANRQLAFHQLTVELEVVATDIVTIRKLITDIELAISKDETFGGTAMRTQPIDNTINASQERDSIGGAVLTVRIDYRTDKFRAT